MTLATFPVQAGANAIQMQVALGQSTDKAGMDGAEASGLLSAAIGSIRTVAAFTMQESIQGSYQKAISPLSSSRKVRGLVTGVIFGFTQFVLFASYGLLFWFGGKLVSDGKVRPSVVHDCLNGQKHDQILLRKWFLTRPSNRA